VSQASGRQHSQLLSLPFDPENGGTLFIHSLKLQIYAFSKTTIWPGNCRVTCRRDALSYAKRKTCKENKTSCKAVISLSPLENVHAFNNHRNPDGGSATSLNMAPWSAFTLSWNVNSETTEDWVQPRPEATGWHHRNL
jgi:hypothetical protein